MEEQHATAEPSQQFENVDFSSSPDDDNIKDSSNNEDQEQVQLIILQHILK